MMSAPEPAAASRTPRRPMAEYVITDEVIAAIAAHAAGATPGVARLQPGLAGLLGEFSRRTRQRLGLAAGAATGGVEVERAAGGVTLRLEIAADGHDQAAAVARAAQQAVARAVSEGTGLAVESVAIRILDIDVYARAGRAGGRGDGDD